MQEPQDAAPAENGRAEGEDLNQSFRQSRREFWFLIGTWVAFAGWTMMVNVTQSRFDGEGSVATLLGMPRWVVLGIALPWVVATGLTCWFALRFMKDTSLEGLEGAEEGGE